MDPEALKKELSTWSEDEAKVFCDRVNDIFEYSYTGNFQLIETAVYNELVLYYSYSGYPLQQRIFDKRLWCLAFNDEKSTFKSLTKSRIFDKHLVSLIADFVTIRGKWELIDSDPYWEIAMDGIKKTMGHVYGNIIERSENLFRLKRKIKINDISLIEVRYEPYHMLRSIYILFLPDFTPVHFNINDTKKFYFNGYIHIGVIYEACKESSMFCL